MLVDISNNQGNINFSTLKNEVEGVIIRCGWGGNNVSQDDPKYNEYITECERNNIPYGVYLYSYALNTDSAISEAKHTLRLVGDKSLSYGVWFDMEDADHYKSKHGINVYQNRQLLTDICKVYCDTIKKAGYEVGVYASYDYWKNVLFKEQLSEYPIWLAQWGVSQPSIPCTIWQYTSNGVVNGINGRVDCDIYYGKTIDTTNNNEINNDVEIKISMPLIKKGSSGKVVKVWQSIVDAGVDGIFGSETESQTKQFQSRYGLTIDGIVGQYTWNKAYEILKA